MLRVLLSLSSGSKIISTGYDGLGRIGKVIVWIGLVILSGPLGSSQGLEIGSCSSLSLAKPGNGQSYQGEVRNEFYGFRVAIPKGLKAWGAGPSAPFHGFMVYLGQTGVAASCIDLDMSMLVNIDSEQVSAIQQESGTRVRVGDRLGFRRVSHGIVGGKDLENIVVDFHWAGKGDSYRLAVTFVTPTSNADETRPIFERFLSSLVFK